MTITRATEETEIKEGQWVHGPSALEHALFSESRQVTMISGKRIYYRRHDGSASQMNLSQVVIVCDTEAESIAVSQLAYRRHNDISNQIARVLEDAEYKYNVQLVALIEGGV